MGFEEERIIRRQKKRRGKWREAIVEGFGLEFGRLGFMEVKFVRI